MSVPTTDDELLRDGRFMEFLRETYGELPLEEIVYQFRNADGETKRLMRLEFYKWRKQRGYFGEVKTRGKDDVDFPLPV